MKWMECAAASAAKRAAEEAWRPGGKPFSILSGVLWTRVVWAKVLGDLKATEVTRHREQISPCWYPKCSVCIRVCLWRRHVGIGSPTQIDIGVMSAKGAGSILLNYPSYVVVQAICLRMYATLSKDPLLS